MISSLIHLEIYIVLFVGRGTSISCSKLPALLSQLKYEVSPKYQKIPITFQILLIQDTPCSKFSSFLILLILKSPHSKFSSFQIFLTSKFYFSKFSSVVLFCRQTFMGKLLEKAVSKFRHQVGLLILPYICTSKVSYSSFLTTYF